MLTLNALTRSVRTLSAVRSTRDPLRLASCTESKDTELISCENFGGGILEMTVVKKGNEERICIFFEYNCNYRFHIHLYGLTIGARTNIKITAVTGPGPSHVIWSLRVTGRLGLGPTPSRRVRQPALILSTAGGARPTVVLPGWARPRAARSPSGRGLSLRRAERLSLRARRPREQVGHSRRAGGAAYFKFFFS